MVSISVSPQSGKSPVCEPGTWLYQFSLYFILTLKFFKFLCFLLGFFLSFSPFNYYSRIMVSVALLYVAESFLIQAIYTHHHHHHHHHHQQHHQAQSCFLFWKTSCKHAKVKFPQSWFLLQRYMLFCQMLPSCTARDASLVSVLWCRKYWLPRDNRLGPGFMIPLAWLVIVTNNDFVIRFKLNTLPKWQAGKGHPVFFSDTVQPTLNSLEINQINLK